MSTSKAVKTQSKRPAPVITKVSKESGGAVGTTRATVLLATLYYTSVALLAGLVLITVMRAWTMDPRVAINDGGDGLFVQVLAKAVREGWWFHLPNLGAPFGADLIDIGIACTIDYIFFKIIGLFTSEPGLIVNMYWLISVMLSAVSAAFCLRRVGVTSTISFVLGILFALSPWTFWRNTIHILLPLYLIPPVVLFAYHVLRGTIQVQSKKLQRGLIAALFATGLLHTYIPFFAAFILFLVLVFRSFSGFRDPSVRIAALGLGVLLLGTGLNLAPTIVYRARFGSIPEFKQMQEADIYGLKLRQLVTPITQHPLPPLRWVAKKINDAGFPLENENRSSQLGTTGTLGFLLLLGYGLLIVAKPVPHRFPELNPLVFIVCSLVLLGTIGGFGSIFNVFATPSFRTYNRVSIFILFCSLAATGLLLTRLSRSHYFARPVGPVVGVLMLTGRVCLGIGDQVFAHDLISRYPVDRQNFMAMRSMVRNVESVMAPGDAIFQLPHTEFINDSPPGRMTTYDHARVYLHSQKLRLSWGALTGRNGDWGRSVSQYPAQEMLEALLLAGFSGVWVDTAGYPAGGVDITTFLSQQTGRPALQSGDSRFMFFDIRPLRGTLLQRLSSSGQLERKRTELLHPVHITWDDGFYGQEPFGTTVFRWVQTESAMGLRNTLDRVRWVTLRMTTKSLLPAPLEISYRGVRETVQVRPGEDTLAIGLELPPNSSTPLKFRFLGPATQVPGDPRSFAFMAINPLVTDGVPSKAAAATGGR